MNDRVVLREKITRDYDALASSCFQRDLSV